MCCDGPRAVRGCLQSGHVLPERHQSLVQLCVWLLLFFQCGNNRYESLGFPSKKRKKNVEIFSSFIFESFLRGRVTIKFYFGHKNLERNATVDIWRFVTLFSDIDENSFSFNILWYRYVGIWRSISFFGWISRGIDTSVNGRVYHFFKQKYIL